MLDIRTEIKNSKSMEVDSMLESKIREVENLGYRVEFGNIGTRTTYALLVDQNTGDEIVGYTFIKEMKYYRENIGKLKALQQALARKRVADSRE